MSRLLEVPALEAERSSARGWCEECRGSTNLVLVSKSAK